MTMLQLTLLALYLLGFFATLLSFSEAIKDGYLDEKAHDVGLFIALVPVLNLFFVVILVWAVVMMLVGGRK